MEDGEIQNYMTTAAAVQFSYEYKFDVSTAPYLGFVQQYGRVITPEEEIWTRINTSAGEKRSLTNWLLGLAICLFLADVAMRRFQYVPRWSWAAKLMRKDKNARNDRVGNAQESVAPTRDELGSAAQDAQGLGAQTQEVQEQYPSGKGGKAAKDKESKRAKKSKPSEQTLDTSQLLKKKDNRNI